MCGICGIARAHTSGAGDRDRVRRMTEAITHRGPDDDGYYFDDRVGLGMRRLSIIDVTGGHQPIANEQRTVHLVHNGEVYNHRELRKRLERAGHRFATRSDSEVIIHAYEEEGVASLNRLRGMLAVGVWDSRAQELVLAVDRFGIKPLYYSADQDRLVFGSELKCLTESGLVSNEIDLNALAQFFTFGYVPPPATIFAGVRKLAPGSVLTWSADRGAAVRQYWEPPARIHDGPRVGAAETRSALREAVADAVRAHLVSDVPVGAFLSGGVDSSVVVALMSEAMSEPVRTFSIGFQDPRYSELDKARTVARRYSTDHHELIVEPEGVDVLPELVTHFGEPFADSSALPTYYVARMASSHVKVVLSGDGGDEVFLGYTLFRGLELARHVQLIPERLRKLTGELAAVSLPRTGDPSRNDRLALLRKRVGDTLLPPEAAFERKLAAPGLDEIAPLLSPELRNSLALRDPFTPVRHWLGSYANGTGGHPLEPFARTGFQISLPGDMLTKVDRMSMANSLEVRVPLLDHLLVEHVATVPMQQLMPRWRLKGLLKDTFSDALPNEVLKSPKRGFTVPLSAWFRGDLTNYAREVLLSPEARQRGYFDPASLGKTLAMHRAGVKDAGTVIWNLLMFELWCQEALS
jgi:asparagine synthase (glutamine-hydrolysing)